MENEMRTLAELLEETLRIKNISLEKLALLSGISERFLNGLLGGHTENLPAAPYVRGYLMKIADVLGLNGEDLWSAYLKHDTAIRRSGAEDSLPGNRFVLSKLRSRLIIILGAILIVLVIAVMKIPALFGGASLTIGNMEPNMIVHEQSFVVRGSVDNKDTLTINGDIVYPKENGDFEHAIELQKGFNTIEFKIKRFLGKETTITKQIFYEISTSTEHAIK